MRKPEFASKKAVSHAAYWKHPRKLGKRTANKSELIVGWLLIKVSRAQARR